MADQLALSSGEEKVYSALWNEAVGLLMESKLDEPILHEIWEHSDLEGEGYLNIEGFKIAMKLVALVQAGYDADMSLLKTATGIADLGKHTESLLHLAAAPARKVTESSGATEWIITPDEKARYDESFNQLGPTAEDIITGKKARKVLMKTGLPQDVLGKIWELADIDSDGNLDRDEFAVAMHLIRSCMGGKSPPDTLPPDHVPPSKRDNGGAAATEPAAGPPSKEVKEPDTPPSKSKDSTTSTASPASVVTAAAPAAKAPASSPSTRAAPSSGIAGDWIVTAKELKTYDEFFRTADKDKNGLVSGGDIGKIFLTSKLPKDVLAHIWNLVDLDDSGEINSEQFALAMHFIAQKVKGNDIPESLAPNMVPPSLRERFGSGGDGADSGPAAELSEAKQTNAQLKAQIEATTAEVAAESADLDTMLAEIKQLRAEEKKLRAELKEGKDKLVEVLAQKRKAKADKKKIEGKISTLAASKSKVEAGLKSAGYYDSAGGASKPVEMETHGMSMADYFGQQ